MRQYTRTLMGWAGELCDYLVLDDLPLTDALSSAIEAAELEDNFREKNKGGKRCLVCRRAFDQRFGL